MHFTPWPFMNLKNIFHERETMVSLTDNSLCWTILSVCLYLSVCLSNLSILTPVQLPQGQKVCHYNFLAVWECALKID